jgi:hypothetical protein
MHGNPIHPSLAAVISGFHDRFLVIVRPVRLLGRSIVRDESVCVTNGLTGVTDRPADESPPARCRHPESLFRTIT